MALRPPLWRLSGPSPIVAVSPRHRRCNVVLSPTPGWNSDDLSRWGRQHVRFARLSNFPNTYRACGNAGSRRLNSATTHLGSHKLHDLYAPPFEAAVGDGGLQSVIDSYSPVTVTPSLHHARY